MNETYNGWANYETWCCTLWINNNAELYTDIRSTAQALKGHLDVFARYLEDNIVDNMPAILPQSMYSDLLTNAIQNIDFYEIAKEIMEEIENDD